MQVDFTCTVGPEDWAGAYALHLERPTGSTSFFLILFLGGLGLVWAMSMLSSEEVGYTLLAIALSVCVAYAQWFHRIHVPRFGRRAHAHTKAWHGLMRVLVDDAGVQLHTDCLNLRQPWSHFTKWKENGHLFLVYEATACSRSSSPSAAWTPRRSRR